jgi:hypothetical protein
MPDSSGRTTAFRQHGNPQSTTHPIRVTRERLHCLETRSESTPAVAGDDTRSVPLRTHEVPAVAARDLEVDTVRSGPVDLSVIVPTYCGGDRVYENMCRLSRTLDTMPYTHEIVIVSDGNTDCTDQEIQRVATECPRVRAFHYARNQGKGYALTYGVARSRGRLITFIDGDGDIDPQQIASYLTIMLREQADVVVGSKRHPDSEVIYPPVRRLYSWGYQTLLRLLFNLQVRDTQVGLKVFRREVLQKVLPRIVVKRYAFDLELLVVACHLGHCRIIEAPVTVGQRFSSTISRRAVWNILQDTLAIFYRKHVLRYYDRTEEVELHRVPLLIMEPRPRRLAGATWLQRYPRPTARCRGAPRRTPRHRCAS